ncbi:LysR family transcriptional regulator [Desulforhopalus vacuolatus]|uniref:selenium metabolism-associated LysR family transcriptional regulator n=1 Tax=Desulforhopalus vacuolatus TaxID=40414 RepID=UPI001963145A|nr:selenium metabolism-associated LysR family transcriptional regulator [Desulforhopalus vacuolatus]MBM9519537.1 LysR family transcriptional regulator [Desulforhopalus vacuolatus]
METRHLKVFLAVFRHRSFTKAAESLFTSQPTVSEHIQNLENQLGVQLFDRLGRTIIPTAEAEILYEGAKKILSDIEMLQERVSRSAETVAGELIIGASSIPGTWLLPARAAEFKKKYPQISFEIRVSDSAEVVKEVADNELILGIVGAQTTSSRVKYSFLETDELLLVTSADSTLPDKITPEQLYATPFVQRESGSGTRKSFESKLQETGINPARLNIAATLGSSAAAKEAVRVGLGVTIISSHAVEQELQSGVMRQVKIPGVSMKRDFYIVLPARRTLPNHYALFADFLQGI